MVAAAGHRECYDADLDGISPAVETRWMHNDDDQLEEQSLMLLAVLYDMIKVLSDE